MHSNVEASGMVPSRSSHQHGPPLLRRVRCLRSPTSSLVCGPPTPSPPSIAASVAPRGRPATTARGAVRASQVPGASSSSVPRFQTPSVAPTPRPICGIGTAVFEHQYALDSGDIPISRLTHAAHSFACLRIAASVTGHVARLATGLPGSALAGRDSHPLDTKQNFRSLPQLRPSLLTSLAWSHTGCRLRLPATRWTTSDRPRPGRSPASTRAARRDSTGIPT